MVKVRLVDVAEASCLIGQHLRMLGECLLLLINAS